MKTDKSNAQLAPVIIGKLLNIGGMLQRKGNQILQPFGFNQQQFSIFFEIAKKEKVKQKDIINRLLLEKAHISKVVKKLQKMELIIVTEADEDKRSYWLELTHKGKEILSKCMIIFEEWNESWLGNIDEKQLITILENLTLLQAIFKNKIQDEKETL